MNIKEIKNILLQLKKNNIYDYECKCDYYKLFSAFYEKKEAIDFLKSKIDKDITYLYQRIDPIDRTMTIKKIQDFEECINIFTII